MIMNLSLEVIILAVVNLIGIGVAFGTIRAKLKIQDDLFFQHRAEERDRMAEFKRDVDDRFNDLRIELKATQDRFNNLVEKYHEIALLMVRKDS